MDIGGGKLKKGAGGRRGGCPKKKSVSRSVKAGFQFPVGRIGRFLKKGRYTQRVRFGAPVYVSVVLEYLAAEALGPNILSWLWPTANHIGSGLRFRTVYDLTQGHQHLNKVLTLPWRKLFTICKFVEYFH